MRIGTLIRTGGRAVRAPARKAKLTRPHGALSTTPHSAFRILHWTASLMLGLFLTLLYALASPAPAAESGQPKTPEEAPVKINLAKPKRPPNSFEEHINRLDPMVD